jgi:dolichol kinase
MASIPKDELKRKGFHLLSLVYVFGYWYLDKNIVIWGLAAAISLVALLELLRFNVPKFNEFFCNNFKGFYRPDEAKKISGLLGTLSGALITVLLFSNKYMVFASFLYLAFGDSIAAIVGRSIGKHKTFFGKSFEGSAACFTACLICGLFIFDWKFALAGAFIATAVEAVPWKINDNFWMQIINAALLTFLSGVMTWAK